jgi:hypothetical protein
MWTNQDSLDITALMLHLLPYEEHPTKQTMSDDIQNKTHVSSVLKSPALRIVTPQTLLFWMW